MQYLLMIYDNEVDVAALGPEKLGLIMSGYMAYTEAMRKAGVLVNSNRLQPVATATSVRVQGGKTNVLNGPYAETKEQLGGYYLIDVPDLDAALSWAARCPGSEIGTIEVRPIWEM